MIAVSEGALALVPFDTQRFATEIGVKNTYIGCTVLLVQLCRAESSLLSHNRGSTPQVL